MRSIIISVSVAKKLTINSFSSSQECSHFDKYLNQLARLNKDGYIELTVAISEDDKTDWSTVTLIYRANIFERKLPPSKSYQKPRAINWRWRLEQP
jgi:hypothetical protein